MVRKIFIASLIFFLLASVFHFLLVLIFGRSTAAFMHMPVYHWTHPYHFIGIVSLLFFLLLVLSQLTISKIKNAPVQYLLFYFTWILLSAVCGGLLWSWFDMKAGHFPEGKALYTKLREDAYRGLTFGGRIILFSVPYNLILFIISFILLRKMKLFTLHQKEHGRRK